jgi:hypothetical protein
MELRHSISETIQECPECAGVECMKKIPSMPIIISKAKNVQQEPVGTLVKQYIEETKNDLNIEKKRLKKIDYDKIKE